MRGSSFFLHGHGGTGKTYLYNCTISKVRSRGQIALVVASLGIVAALLPDGLTAHSRFKILLNVDHSPTCMVKKGMTLAELLKAATLIVWDEAPMVHRLSFEVVDRTLCDIMNIPLMGPDYQPFGGKTILLGGDFRQTLPVVPNGGCEDNINASLPRSSVWNHCTLLQLSINMRINDLPINNEPILDGLTFSQWVLSVGNGLLVTTHNGTSHADWIKIPQYFVQKSHAIVTPTNAIVSEINDFMLNQIPGELQTYFSADSLTTTGSNKEALEMEYHIEFLNSLSFNGIPEHDLKLKPFSTVMLLRNLNPLVGLCNGTQILLTNLGNHLLQGLIVGGTMKDSVVAIPCIVLDVKVVLCNDNKKSKGQTLDKVGVYLPKPVFSHGQSYVAVSRVRSADGFHIVLGDPESASHDVTRNIVYDEVLQGLIDM
ncbi:ATP-dependent DNA helicase pif1 [Linum perenne]